MRGAYFQYMKEKGFAPGLDASAAAAALHKEKCELRLARIANGKEPGYDKPKHKTALAK